jgi:cell division ATPase FtsA
VEFAGLDVMGLRYSLEVFARLAQALAPAAARLLLVDVGGLQTDVGLSVGGRLVAAQTLAWGGLTFAHELARASRLNIDQATALTLEGLASRKREVREALEPRLDALEQVIRRVLENQPAPDAVRVCGRGVLIDGLVEWIERAGGAKATVQRSARTQAMTDLARQVGTTMAIALLEHGAAPADRLDGANHRLVDRLIGRTKILLAEYF